MRTCFSQGRRPEKKPAPLTYEESLRFDLKLAKWELDNAYAGFDYVTDPDLVDCYIFKLNAAMKRYKYLIEKYNAMKKETVIFSGEGTAQPVTPNESTLQPLANG